MKVKQLLKFGIPLVAITGLAISLPLALTSCSDSNSTGIKTNTPDKIDLNKKDPYHPQDLKVIMKGNMNQYSFQWYYKTLDKTASTTPSSTSTLSTSSVKLSDETSDNNNIDIKKWTAIPGATTNELDISSQYFYNGSAVDKKYVCQITTKKDNSISYSQPTEIQKPEWLQTAQVVSTNLSDVQALQNASDLFTSTTLADLISSENNELDVVNSGTTQTLFGDITSKLGLSNQIEHIKSISLSFEPLSPTSQSRKLVAKISLIDSKEPSQSWTWGANLYANANDENHYSFDLSPSTNDLMISNINTQIFVEENATPMSAFIVDNGKITGLTPEGKKLTNIVIPENKGITEIAPYAFSNDNQISTKVHQPEKDNTILQSVTIPSSVTKIDQGAFAFCTNLTSVNFEHNSGLTTIVDGAFVGTKKLTSFSVPSSVTNIGSRVFIDSGIQSLKFDGQNNVTLGSGAFSWCKSLVKVTLPSNQTTLPEYAFGEDTVLNQINLPSSLTSIGLGAFQSSGITNLDLSSTKITIIPESTFAETPNLTTVTLPNTLTTIATNSFYQSGITSIDIPASVTSISYGQQAINGAFSKCKNLKSVTFEAESGKVTPNLTIGQYTFSGCTSLTQITLPTRTQQILSNAFDDTGLTTITILATQAPTMTTHTFDLVKNGLIVKVANTNVEKAVKDMTTKGQPNLGIVVQLISNSSSTTHSFYNSNF